MIKDTFGRVHDYLRISLTDKCNFRCAYCLPALKQGKSLNGVSLFDKQLLTDDEILEIAGIFVNDFGIKRIRFTGGEPLVRKNVGKIIEAVSEMPVELAITTNGILIDKYISSFKNIGLSSINISLDTLIPERFHAITGRQKFDELMNNINLLLKNEFYVKINTVVVKGINDDEINTFIEWTRDLPIHVRFIEFMPFNGNKWDWNKVVTYKEILERIENVYPAHLTNGVEKLKDGANSTSKSYRVKGFLGTFAIISSVTTPFCDDCNRIRLTADGKLKNCLFSNDETDLLAALRNGKDIRPLISESIAFKHEKRGGLSEFNEIGASNEYKLGRSMNAIGG